MANIDAINVGGTNYSIKPKGLDSFTNFPKMFLAMTASESSLYISIPAPPLAASAEVSGTASLTLRSDSDERTTFTPSSCMLQGGALLVEGTINPQSKHANTCMAGWLESGSIKIEWK